MRFSYLTKGESKMNAREELKQKLKAIVQAYFDEGISMQALQDDFDEAVEV